MANQTKSLEEETMKKIAIMASVFALIFVVGCSKPAPVPKEKVVEVPVITEKDFARLKSMLENCQDSCSACKAQEEAVAMAMKRESKVLENTKALAIKVKMEKERLAYEEYQRKDLEGFRVYHKAVIQALNQFEKEDNKTFVKFCILTAEYYLAYGIEELWKFQKEKIPSLQSFLIQKEQLKIKRDSITEEARKEREQKEKEANDEYEEQLRQAKEKYDQALKTVRVKLGLERP